MVCVVSVALLAGASKVLFFEFLMSVYSYPVKTSLAVLF